MTCTDKDVDDQQELVKVLQYRFYNLLDEQLAIQNKISTNQDLLNKAVDKLHRMKQK